MELNKIPCRVIEGLTNEERLKRQVAENWQRTEMSPMEIGIALKAFKDMGYSLRSIAKMVGKHHETVAGYLTLPELPKELQEAVNKGTMLGMPIQTVSKK